MKGNECKELSFHNPSGKEKERNKKKSLRVIKSAQLYSFRREGHKEKLPLKKENSCRKLIVTKKFRII